MSYKDWLLKLQGKNPDHKMLGFELACNAVGWNETDRDSAYALWNKVAQKTGLQHVPTVPPQSFWGKCKQVIGLTKTVFSKEPVKDEDDDEYEDD